ncbi:hypothetical protein EK0264_00095 [Epidermidibacterium keratini]|uniref:VWFA domain-containing protein n=1 Tax=Epidermidibacterium keratini TaxID=1891644 RepID=A0A7M3T507_9ACTN|nr:hypothetical protein [Epidermidibacterium keratini]QHB98858.1 hypothetical protein EK0264_00095 [Epidermidibacterium keratini]
MSPRGHNYRYGSWHDGPDPLAAPLDVRGAALDVGRSMLGGRNVRDAVRELLRRGQRDRPGLDELRKKIRERRNQLRKRGNLGGALDRARAALDQALATEREQLASEDTDQARFDEMLLDELPDSVSSAMQELDSYDWHSDEARQQYEQIKAGLREQVLDQQFNGIKQALQNPDPEAMQRVRDMMADLNSLLAAHARGEDTEQQFADFMDKHGDFFPDNPKDVDELIDQLARQQAEAERLLRSMTPEQRAEIESLIEQAMSDVDLASQMAQLRDNLQNLRPGMMRGQGMPVNGEQPLNYGEAAGVIGELTDLEALDRQLGQDYPGSTLDDVDVEALERQLGSAATRDLQALRELEAELQRQGFVRREGGKLSLTPKALRQLGESTLRRIFADIRSQQQGRHEEPRTGSADDRTGAYLPWHFGSEQPIDAVRTVTNAVLRTAGDERSDDRLRLVADDFVVAETERRSRAAVALLVDLSFSMVQQDRWEPMKETALALAHLVETRFRQDALQIIGFNIMAQPLSALELAEVEPEWVQGTNLEHAMLLAGRHLRRHPDAEPVVLVVTDGEPTAHLVDGEPWFDWPTTPACVRATVRQVDELSRYGASINFFRLGEDPGLERFIDATARRCGGRVFSPSLRRLGEYVVSDYLQARRGRRGAA